MQRRLRGILGVLLLAGMAMAQTKAAAGEDVVAAIKAQEDRWTQASLKGDAAALAAVLADGFVSTSNAGVVRTKAEQTAALKTGKVKFTSGRIDDLKVAVYGNAAVATGRWQGTGTEDGKPFNETERFTDTWIKQGGQWLCVASQGTLIKK